MKPSFGQYCNTQPKMGISAFHCWSRLFQFPSFRKTDSHLFSFPTFKARPRCDPPERACGAFDWLIEKNAKLPARAMSRQFMDLASFVTKGKTKVDEMARRFDAEARRKSDDRAATFAAKTRAAMAAATATTSSSASSSSSLSSSSSSGPRAFVGLKQNFYSPDFKVKVAWDAVFFGVAKARLRWLSVVAPASQGFGDLAALRGESPTPSRDALPDSTIDSWARRLKDSNQRKRAGHPTSFARPRQRSRCKNHPWSRLHSAWHCPSRKNPHNRRAATQNEWLVKLQAGMYSAASVRGLPA